MRNLSSILFLGCCLLTVAGLWAQQPGVPNSPNKPGATAVSKPGATASVGEILRYTNSLFDRYNDYNSSLNVDMLTNELIFKDKFSELRGNFSAVEFRRSGENMGIFCKSGGDCLSSKDVDTGSNQSSRSQYTFGIKENGNAIPEMDGVIQQLNTMLGALAANGGSTNYSSNSYVSAVVKDNLKVINNAFDKYNGYDTTFSVEGNRLKWVSSVATVSAELSELTFYVNYKNKWMVMKCVNGDCLEGSSSKGDYSMGLQTSSGSIAPNIMEVLEAFNNVRHDVLANQ